jgi:ADP-ribose pyrophosphatase YjhB (NUDIX family)
MVTAVPKLLEWARELQAIAQSGLAWQPSDYERERYEQVRRIAAEMYARADGRDADEIEGLFAAEVGHATPKLDTRGVVFRGEQILLVHERAGGCWSLPGGWVDVGESPSEAVTREVLEESGYRTRAAKLLALYDRDRRGYPPHPWHIWKAVFLCELVDEEQARLGSETVAAGFFRRSELADLPLRFTGATLRELDRCFEQREHPEWPTQFD